MVILARQLAACFAWSRTDSSIYTCTCTYSYIIDHYGRPENESDRCLLCYAIRDREAYATIGWISACAHNVFSRRRQPISVFRPIIPRRLAHLSIWAHLLFYYYCTWDPCRLLFYNNSLKTIDHSLHGIDSTIIWANKKPPQQQSNSLSAIVYSERKYCLFLFAHNACWYILIMDKQTNQEN